MIKGREILDILKDQKIVNVSIEQSLMYRQGSFKILNITFVLEDDAIIVVRPNDDSRIEMNEDVYKVIGDL